MNEIINNLDLSPAIAKFITDRVEIVGSKTTPCCVVLTDAGYRLQISPNLFKTFSPLAQRELIYHELAHIWRGDLLRLKAENLNISAWNIATDAVINASLPRLRVEGGIDIDNDILIPRNLPLSTERIWSAIEIYRLIAKAPQTIPNAIPDLSNEQENSNLADEAAAHMRDKHELSNAIASDNVENKVFNKEKTIKHAGIGAGNSQWTDRSKKMLPVYCNIEEWIKRGGTKTLSKIKEKSYARPGRVPGLADKRARLVTPVALYLDVSGSTSEVWEELLAIARWMQKKHNASVFLFDDGVRPWRGEATIAAGGGTVIRKVLDHIRETKPSVAIVATDGEFFDPVARADAEGCVWILTPGALKPPGATKIIDWPK